MKIIIFLVFSFPLFAQDKAINDFFEGKTKIENPAELRDPFKMPDAAKSEVAKEKVEKKGFIKLSETSYTNVIEPEVKSVSDIQIVGVLIGKDRRAFARVGDKLLQLKEGMKIGADEIELKAIHPGGVILVEKIVNVYGQEEFLETVIPISN